jgi:hypothetical protein
MIVCATETDQAHVLGERGGGQGDRRQDQVAYAAGSEGGQETAQLDGEKQDQHETEPEARHRLEEERREAARVIDDAVLVGGRGDAERNRQHRREQERGGGQLDRRRPEVLEHHLHRRSLLADRGSEIAARDRPQELEILDVERAVQAELAAGLGDLLLSRALIYEKRSGITGQADQEEDGGDHAPEHEHRVKRATEQEGAHRRRVISSRRRRGSPCSAPAAA